MSEAPKLNSEQKSLIEGLQGSLKTHQEIIDSLKKQLAIGDRINSQQEEMIESLKAAKENTDALIEAQKARMDMIDRQIEALEQAEMASRAMQQTADYYSSLSRATLVYILERGEKERGWLRLWEALPQDQKDVYLEEARTWLGKQISHVDPELRARMKPPPNRED